MAGNVCERLVCWCSRTAGPGSCISPQRDLLVERPMTHPPRFLPPDIEQNCRGACPFQTPCRSPWDQQAQTLASVFDSRRIAQLARRTRLPAPSCRWCSADSLDGTPATPRSSSRPGTQFSRIHGRHWSRYQGGQTPELSLRARCPQPDRWIARVSCPPPDWWHDAASMVSMSAGETMA